MCINQSKKFIPYGIRRSLFLCERKRRKAELLADLVETETSGTGELLFVDEEGTLGNGIVVDKDGMGQHCKNVRKKSGPDLARNVTLFTLNHGEFGTVVLDWGCSSCSYLNRYSGSSHGIFPDASGTACTVELMYTWIEEIWLNTRSFRLV